MKTNHKRIIAATLAGWILILVLLSAAAVVLEATHDCDGENCGVCRILYGIVSTVRCLTVMAVVSLFVILTDLLRRLSLHSDFLSAKRTTPITEKVRLLN